MAEWSFRNLNLKGVNPARVSMRLPVGRHAVTITEAKMQPMKSGNGSQLYIKMEADDGNIAEDYITVFHDTSEDAQRIGRERLAGLLHASGHPSPENPGDVRSLLNLRVGVIVEEDEFTNDKGAKVKTTKPKRNGGAYFQLRDASPVGSTSRVLEDDGVPF